MLNWLCGGLLKGRERARRFGHGIVIYENGKIVEKPVTREQGDG
jgi:hypothetical protein